MASKFFCLSTHSAAAYVASTGTYTFGPANVDLTLLRGGKMTVSTVTFNGQYVNVTSGRNVMVVKFHGSNVELSVTVSPSTGAPYSTADYATAISNAIAIAIASNSTLNTAAATCVVAHNGSAFTFTSNQIISIKSNSTTLPMSLIGFTYLLDKQFPANTAMAGMRVASVEDVPPFYIVISTRVAPICTSVDAIISAQSSACVALVVPTLKRGGTSNLCTIAPLSCSTCDASTFRNTDSFSVNFIDARSFAQIEFADTVDIMFEFK